MFSNHSCTYLSNDALSCIHRRPVQGECPRTETIHKYCVMGTRVPRTYPDGYNSRAPVRSVHPVTVPYVLAVVCRCHVGWRRHILSHLRDDLVRGQLPYNGGEVSNNPGERIWGIVIAWPSRESCKHAGDEHHQVLMRFQLLRFSINSKLQQFPLATSPSSWKVASIISRLHSHHSFARNM